MPFCSFANQDLGFVPVDDAFIRHFLPYADERDIKVYLYGLMLAANPYSEQNRMDNLCVGLDLSEEDVLCAYRYWQEQGIVRIVSEDPLAVQYLSVSKAFEPTRLIPKDKYSDFVVQLGGIFPSRTLSSNEIYMFLQYLEDSHLDPQALLAIAQYCCNRKGEKVHVAYVLTVAKNWAEQGVKSLADAENRILEAELLGGAVREVFHALKKRSEPDIDDYQLYTKWTRSWGFAPDAVLCAAKQVKRGGMAKLDSVLDSFFRMNVFSVGDMQNYWEKRKQTLDTCIKINKVLGLYYESVDHIVESYTQPWLQLGYTEESLLLIAKYCALRSVRTLEGMREVVESFYRQGVVSEHSIKVQLDQYAAEAEGVSRVIEATGSTRGITEADRDLYRTWSVAWGLDDSLILYAATLAAGKPYPMGNVGNKLSKWRAAGVSTVAMAKQFEQTAATAAPTVAKPAAPIAPVAGSKFRRAELLATLKQDALYRKLDQQIHTLSISMAHYEIDNQPVPATLVEEMNSLNAARRERIVALGIDPAEVE
ncbi:MAG: DnaD domain protein [Clostridia bacterium]|nr:DnaD domain protein [Clostridia bacterium]